MYNRVVFFVVVVFLFFLFVFLQSVCNIVVIKSYSNENLSIFMHLYDTEGGLKNHFGLYVDLSLKKYIHISQFPDKINCC